MNLTLHLTTACNMRCGYCYAPPLTGPSMTEEIGLGALRLAADLNQKHPSGIIFFGGEPLICQPLIRALVEEGLRMKARGEARFHFKITTNGLLLDEDFLSFCDRTGLLVALSIDGVETAHDRHRRLADGGPSFARVHTALRRLLDHQPTATVLCTVRPDTVATFSDSVAFLLDEGVRYLVVSLDHATPWDEDDLSVLADQYTILGERYEAWTRAGRKFYLSPFEMAIATRVAGAQAPCSHRCELGTKQISVDPEGFLYPCVQFTRRGPAWRIGSVRDGIDLTARDALAARSSGIGQPCASCALEPRCPHTCGCLNLQTTGSLEQVSPVLCRAQQILIPIADAVATRLWADREPHFLQKHYNRAWPLLSALEDARRG